MDAKLTKPFVFVAFLALFLSACAVTPPKPTLDRVFNLPFNKSIGLLMRQAEACWRRTHSWTRDGISVDARKSVSDTVLISVSRFAPDIGIRPAFFQAEVAPTSSGQTQVRVVEGDFALGKHLNLSSDIERWLKGDTSCREL